MHQSLLKEQWESSPTKSILKPIWSRVSLLAVGSERNVVASVAGLYMIMKSITVRNYPQYIISLDPHIEDICNVSLLSFPHRWWP